MFLRENKLFDFLLFVKNWPWEVVFFCIWVFFHEHSQFTGQQGKGEAISLSPLYHFHLLHRHLDILQGPHLYTEPGTFGFRAQVANHQAWEMTDGLWYTSNIPIPIPFEKYKLCNQLIRITETDFCIWFSSSFPKPKFSFWFTEIMYKHILNLYHMTGDKQIWTLLGFSQRIISFHGIF